MQSLDFYLSNPQQVSMLSDEEQLSLYQQLTDKVRSLELQKNSLQSQKDLLSQQITSSEQELYSLTNTSSMEEFTKYFTELKSRFQQEQQELLQLVLEVTDNG
jgi:seryl-tRNA synthetase